MLSDNIYVSNEAYINLITMLNVTTNEIQSLINELNQYAAGNLTIEAATDAARELTFKLNEQW